MLNPYLPLSSSTRSESVDLSDSTGTMPWYVIVPSYFRTKLKNVDQGCLEWNSIEMQTKNIYMIHNSFMYIALHAHS